VELSIEAFAMNNFEQVLYKTLDTYFETFVGGVLAVESMSVF